MQSTTAIDKTGHPENQTREIEQSVCGGSQTSVIQATPPDYQAVASSSGGSASMGFSETRMRSEFRRISSEGDMSAYILELMQTVTPRVRGIGSEGPDLFEQVFHEYGPRSLSHDEPRRITLRAFIRGAHSQEAVAHARMSEYFINTIPQWQVEPTQYLEVKLNGDGNTEEVEIEREPSDCFETGMTRGPDVAITWSSLFSCRIKWSSCKAIQASPECVHGRVYLEYRSRQPDAGESSITDAMKQELLQLPSGASIPPASSQVDEEDGDCNSEGIEDDLPSLF